MLSPRVTNQHSQRVLVDTTPSAGLRVELQLVSLCVNYPSVSCQHRGY